MVRLIAMFIFGRVREAVCNCQVGIRRWFSPLSFVDLVEIGDQCQSWRFECNLIQSGPIRSSRSELEKGTHPFLLLLLPSTSKPNTSFLSMWSMAAAFPNSPETQTSALSPQSSVVEENWLGSIFDNLVSFVVVCYLCLSPIHSSISYFWHSLDSRHLRERLICSPWSGELLIVLNGRAIWRALDFRLSLQR